MPACTSFYVTHQQALSDRYSSLFLKVQPGPRTINIHMWAIVLTLTVDCTSTGYCHSAQALLR